MRYPDEALVLLGVVRVSTCRRSSAELALGAAVDVEEEGQEEVAVLPESSLVIDAGLLVLTDHTLLRARWRHLGQRAGVIECVDDLDLVVLVVDLGAKNLVACEDDLGGV